MPHAVIADCLIQGRRKPPFLRLARAGEFGDCCLQELIVEYVISKSSDNYAMNKSVAANSISWILWHDGKPLIGILSDGAFAYFVSEHVTKLVRKITFSNISYDFKKFRD
jgi:hypothetical protein